MSGPEPNESRHTGHSSLTASGCPRLRADAMTRAAVRAIPATLTDDGRRAYLEIAQRAQVEAVNTYSVLCLGLQAYVTTAHLRDVDNPG
ncbi:MAG: hypothetical protein ACKVI4_17570 [Actinomycetales bacterium]